MQLVSLYVKHRSKSSVACRIEDPQASVRKYYERSLAKYYHAERLYR
jgi:hypothetical protein